MVLKKVKKIYVAMSGGVDSSVAAALLKKQGNKVVGVFFKPWSPPDVVYCNWEQDRLDALNVAIKLGIEFKTWDFSKEYEKEVVRYMISSYRKGITPNPDVMCNKEIKFGLFLKKALHEGADYIATGHYARKKRAFELLKAKDPNKDQTYFLWTLTPEHLKKTIFPIGEFTKPQVRKLAKKFGLVNHDKKDSQGVCFVGQLNMKEFLKKYIEPSSGNIVLNETGKVIGKHEGIYYYTIGQRHGLDIKNGSGPYFVIKKDIKKKIIYVTSEKSQLMSSSAQIEKINIIKSGLKLPLDCQIKIRYRTESVPAKIIKEKTNNKLSIKFKKPVKALTSGQSAVFYKGNVVFGGGVII